MSKQNEITDIEVVANTTENLLRQSIMKVLSNLTTDYVNVRSKT